MPERKVKVGSSVGLHARPATIFTQAAAKLPVKVTIGKPGGNAVDARSVLFVLGLDVRGGEEVVLSADGEGADAALDELEALLQRDLDKDSATHQGGARSRAGAPSACPARLPGDEVARADPVPGLDQPHGAGLRPHRQRVRGRPVRGEAHAVQQLAVRDPGRGHEDVVAAHHVVERQHLVDVIAGLLRTTALVVVAGLEPAENAPPMH